MYGTVGKTNVENKNFNLQQLLYRSYLSIIVEVGVEPDTPLSRGPHVYQHRGLGVLRRKEHIKLKTAVGVRRF